MKKHWTEEYPIIVEGLKKLGESDRNRDYIKIEFDDGFKKIIYTDNAIKVKLKYDDCNYIIGFMDASRNIESFDFLDALIRNIHKSELQILEQNQGRKYFHIQGERHSGIIECESRSKAHDLFLEQYPFEDVINIKPVRDKKLAV